MAGGGEVTKADTWMPFYIADYLKATMHLSRDEHGAYMLLIMAAWENGGRLPNRPRALAGIVKASLVEWEEIAPSVLPYFDVDGEFLVHGRVVEEREKAQRLSDARREIGSRGGRPKKQTESEPKPIGLANSNQLPSQTETPSPSPIKLEPTGPNLIPTTTNADVPDTKTMIAEALAAAGDAVNQTSPAVQHAADLRVMVAPAAGEPCTWAEVLDAIHIVAIRQRAKQKPIQSWMWIHADAWALRDKRLNAIAPDVATVVPFRSGAPPSLTDKIAAENAEARRLAFARMDAENG